MPAGRPMVFDRERMEAFIRENPTKKFREIAAEFGCSIHTASIAYYRTFPDEAPPASRRVVARKAHEQKLRVERQQRREARRQAVLKAAAQFPTASYGEIADYLNEKFYFVSRVISGAGQGPGQGYRRGGATNQDDTMMNHESERVQIVAKSLRENWTLQETGEALGVTRERARQLRSIYKQRFPLPDPIKYLVMQEVADEIGANVSRMRELVQEKNIGRPRGHSQRIFTEAEAKEAQHLYMLSIRRTCEKCQKVFFRAFGGGRWAKTGKSFCSPECQRNFHNRRYIDGIANQLTPETASVWKKLVAALDPNRPPETDFISMKQAKEMTGVSTMQLVYLRYRKILRVQPHPTRKRNGVPHNLYSLSDIQTLKKCMPTK